MGYEIEFSIDLLKHRNGNKYINDAQSMAHENNCDHFFHFSELNENKSKSKKISSIMVASFDDKKFDNFTNFLSEIVEKYRKKINIESIYEINNRNLIYASPYYMSLMEKDKREEYKIRRTTRSYSDTDYYILKNILKKIS